MPRFFLPSGEDVIFADHLPESISLSGEDAFHLSVSLRARIGEEVTVCTPQGLEILCTIENISGGKKNPLVMLSPKKASLSDRESPLEITLFQGMPKGKKTDSILQKSTELGVSRVVFVYSDRSVPAPDGEEKKLIRFQRIALEAAMQSERGKQVQVAMVNSLDEAVKEMKQSDVYFACYEKEGERSLKDLVRRKGIGSASFFVGPEGGISEREILLLEREGIPTVTLGKRILRTETASSAVLSMFLLEKEL